MYIYIYRQLCVCAHFYIYIMCVQKSCLFEMGVNENGDATQNDAKLHFEKGIGKHRET